MSHFSNALRRVMTMACFIVPAIAVPASLYAQQAVNVGATDIGGVVTSVKGPQDGVWVIAETTETPTKFTRIVVTDGKGRYLIPICRKPTTASGCAAMALSTRQRCAPSPACNSISRQ